MCARQASTAAIGDGPHFISCLLDKLVQSSHEGAKHVEEVYKQHAPKTERETKQESLSSSKEAKYVRFMIVTYGIIRFV